MAKWTIKKQNEMIAAEKEKLMQIFDEISDDKKEVAERLIDRVAFMTITLQILEEDIKSKGPTYKFEQGSQKMFVENPSQKSYNTMINRYTASCGKLFDLLSDNGEKDPDDGFESFVNSK